MIWRQLTQWLGGMGIIVLAVAILPKLSVGGAQLIQQEAPGPSLEKLTPHIAETARRLWFVYLGLTVLEVLLLYAWHLAGTAPNMHFFQAVSHALTTMPTGGFSPEARSIEAFSASVQWTIIPFMVLAGSNFTLLWFLWDLQPSKLLADREWRSYVGILGGVGMVATVLLLFTSSSSIPTLVRTEEALRHGLFQVVSIVTTTGYASLDYTGWAITLQGLLFITMFTGASAGSTGGSVKIVRWLVVLKSIGRELFVSIHSAAVRPIRLGQQVVKEKTIQSILIFMLLYTMLFLGGSGIILLDCGYHAVDISFQEAAGNAATALGNVGPSFGDNGPMNNFLNLPPISRLTMVILMWLGRLEIVTVLVVFTPAYWSS
jgi:trk system potassium uptake protein TrkH